LGAIKPRTTEGPDGSNDSADRPAHRWNGCWRLWSRQRSFSLLSTNHFFR